MPRTYFALLGLLGLATPSLAADLAALDRGWYDVNGSHTTTNENYTAGEAPNQRSIRNFFVFDLAEVTEEITNGGLRLFVPVNGFSTDQGFETLVLYEVTTDIDELIAGQGGQDAYQDLGDGLEFGSATITGRDRGATITVLLNDDGIAALNNALGGRIAIGGDLVTTQQNESIEFAFGSTSDFDSDARLVVETSAPTVGITVAGVNTIDGVCRNLTDPQTVTVSAMGNSPLEAIDCLEAGLRVSPGDQVRINARAFVVPRDVGRFNGTVTGFTVADPVLCVNTTLGERLPWTAIGITWDCQRAGLTIGSGQLLQIVVSGTVD